MTRMERGAAIVAVACALCSGAAVAQSPNEADRLIRHGVQLRQQRQNDAALREFQQAYALGHEPRAMAQIALAEQALERWVDADRHLRMAMTSSQDDWIVRHRSELDGALALIAQHTAGVRIVASVPGADVWINGARVGVTPLAEPVRVLPGVVAIQVRASGYRTESREVTASTGDVASIRVDLTLQSGGGAAVSSGPGADSTPVEPADGVERPGSAQRTWGWITLVTGAVLVGGGVAGLVVHNGSATDFNNRGCYVPSGTTLVMGPRGSLATCNADYDSIMGTLGIVGLASGGVLAALSVVLLATAPSRTAESHSQATRFGCGQGPGQFGIACAGTF